MNPSENDPLIRKAYIWKWEQRPAPYDARIDYWFCEFAKDAAYWNSRDKAQVALHQFNIGIEIPSAHGGIHICRNFAIEEFAPSTYVVFCTGPFIYFPRDASPQGVGK